MAAASAPPTDTEYRILALYRFVPLIPSPYLECQNDDELQQQQQQQQQQELPPAISPIVERHPTLLALQSELVTTLRKHHVRGTILIAPEGINGTICYPASLRCDDDDDPVASYLKTHPLFGGPELRTRLSVWNENDCDSNNDSDDEHGGHLIKMPTQSQQQHPQQAFQRLKIKIKAEIVTLGLGRTTTSTDGFLEKANLSNTYQEQKHRHQQQRYKSNHRLSNPLTIKGQYLTPEQWDNVAIHDPNILVIDTRNSYEIDIGTFESAINPHTENFSDFPQYLERLAEEYDWNRYYNGADDDGHGTSEANGVRSAAEENRIPKTESTSTSASHSVLEKDGNDQSFSITKTLRTTTLKKKPPPDGIAMFCTGGIRCEKATAYAIQSNLFPKDIPIYHLEGGILAYLDHVAKRKEKRDGRDLGGDADDDTKLTEKKKEDNRGNCAYKGSEECTIYDSKKNCKDTSSQVKSTFHGECFVFDKRVAVTVGLRPSKTYISCHGCRGPMDFRLMLSTNVDDDNGSNTNEEAGDGDGVVATRYQMLADGIPDLPPLQYDYKSRRHYLPGLTCPRCHASTTRESLERFIERNRQVEICKREGKAHFQDLGGGKIKDF